MKTYIHEHALIIGACKGMSLSRIFEGTGNGGMMRKRVMRNPRLNRAYLDAMTSWDRQTMKTNTATVEDEAERIFTQFVKAEEAYKSKPDERNKGGRPAFDEYETVAALIYGIIKGIKISELCKEEGFPKPGTVYAKCLKDPIFKEAIEAARDANLNRTLFLKFGHSYDIDEKANEIATKWKQDKGLTG